MVRPQFGDAVPTDETAIHKSFGYGWWKKNPQAAGELLEAAGFTKQGGKWMMPDGKPFKFTLNTFTDGVINRLGTDIAQQWTQAGVEVTPFADPNIFCAATCRTALTKRRLPGRSRPGAAIPTSASSSTAGIPSSSPKPGEVQTARNWQRWSDPRLDAIIEKVRKTDFSDHDANVALGDEFIKLMVDEMPIIPVMSFNVFSAYDTRYWTGFPTAEENPYANIVNNWANSKYILTQLKPTGK